MAETKVSNRGKKFIKDFGIYTIGALGTRIITFLMVPLYTFFIESPAEYGYFDLCLAVCTLLLPITTLQLREGAFRFLIEGADEQEQKRVVSVISRMLSMNFIGILCLTVIVGSTFDIVLYGYCVALLLLMTLHEVIAQSCRGLGNNKVYIASNLINATGIGVFSIIFVAILGWGCKGIFIANILSRVITVTFIEYKMHIIRCIKLNLQDKHLSKEILRYCLPLIPISLCWYFTISSGRFFIKYYLGLEANGIYAVSIRFTMVLQTLSIIFYQAWQETSIAQFYSKDRDSFFSKVFYDFFYLLVILLISFIFLLKINYSWLVSSAYADSLKYIYPLSIAAIFNGISASFFELAYQCSKDTKRAIPGIISVFIVNILLCVYLTPRYGIWGIAYASIASYLYLDVYRFFDTRRYFVISYSHQIVLPVIVMIVSVVPFYYANAFWQDLLYLVFTLGLMLYFAPNDIKRMIETILHRSSRRKFA